MKSSSLLVALALGLVTERGSAELPSPPGIAALDHLALYVRDVDKSTAFYKDLFGLRQVSAPVPFARWLVLSNGAMLHIVGGRSTPVSNSRWDHFALTCANLTTFVARLKAKGIQWSDVQGRPRVQAGIRGEGVKQILLQDPDGYWIEVNDARTSPQGG